MRGMATQVGASFQRTILETVEGFLQAPLGGLWGVDMVNVLEVNLELRKRCGEPAGSAA
jgi:K+-transporting ATPase c subunit